MELIAYKMQINDKQDEPNENLLYFALHYNL